MHLHEMSILKTHCFNMVKSIIFDLDMTLVDSSIAEQARRGRDWRQVYNLIPNFCLYSGLDLVFEYIKAQNIKVAIVSTSPGAYIKQVCEYFQIPFDYIIGYHDAKPIKPHPAPIYKALTLLETPAEYSIALGDKASDIIAANRAKVTAIACIWGSSEMEKLINSHPNYIIDTPTEIINIIRNIDTL